MCVPSHSMLVSFQHQYTSGDTDGQTFHTDLMQTTETKSQVDPDEILTDPEISQRSKGLWRADPF